MSMRQAAKAGGHRWLAGREGGSADPARRTSRSSEAHNRPDAEFELLRQSSRQDHETAADSDRATAHAPTSGSIRIGSHFASARIANLEPRNCFNPAPKPNEKRVKRSRAAATCVAPALPVRNDRRPLTLGMTNSRVKSA